MDAPLGTVREHNLEVMTEAGRTRRSRWSDGQKAAREGSEACHKGHISFCTRLALCTYRPSPQLPPVHFFCISSLTQLPKPDSSKEQESSFKLKYCNPAILSSAWSHDTRDFSPFAMCVHLCGIFPGSERCHFFAGESWSPPSFFNSDNSTESINGIDRWQTKRNHGVSLFLHHQFLEFGEKNPILTPYFDNWQQRHQKASSYPDVAHKLESKDSNNIFHVQNAHKSLKPFSSSPFSLVFSFFCLSVISSSCMSP